MARPTWPTGIPSPYANSTPAYTPNDTFIRTDTDSGVGKQRRRYTGKSEKLAFTLDLLPAQMTTFWNWYENTIKETLPFDWIDLRTGAAQAYRFTKRPPSQWIAGDSGAGAWAIQVELETVY